MTSHKIFLDVGANGGQTVAAALDWDFDDIYAFEPSSYCWRRLKRFARLDTRVHVKRFGLWNQSGEQTIYSPETKGGSLWRKDNCTSNITERCQFRRASDWFAAAIRPGDMVVMKLNVEGAECDIVDDLLDSGQFDKVDFAMIDFDVRKIAAQRHREADTRARLAAFGFPRIATADRVMVGVTHRARIDNWLTMIATAAGITRQTIAEAAAL